MVAMEVKLLKVHEPRSFYKVSNPVVKTRLRQTPTGPVCQLLPLRPTSPSLKRHFLSDNKMEYSKTEAVNAPPRPPSCPSPDRVGYQEAAPEPHVSRGMEPSHFLLTAANLVLDPTPNRLSV